jgi:hypothetical protein
MESRNGRKKHGTKRYKLQEDEVNRKIKHERKRKNESRNERKKHERGKWKNERRKDGERNRETKIIK